MLLELAVRPIFSSPEHAQGELLGYRDVRRPSYLRTSETSVRQLLLVCALVWTQFRSDLLKTLSEC